MSAAVVDSAAGVDVVAGVDPWQGPSGSVLAWVLAEFAPVLGDAEVLQLDADTAPLRLDAGRAWVPVVAVRIHVQDPDRARTIAAGLDLGAAVLTVRERRTWLRWTGWVPGACPDYPVSVTVIAAEVAQL